MKIIYLEEKMKKKKLFKSKTQMIIYIILFVIFIVLFIYFGTLENTTKKTSDSDKFKNEYKEVNEDNVFVYLNAAETLDYIKKDNILILFGMKNNSFVGNYANILNEVAKNVGIEKYNIAVKNKLSVANSSPISNIGREFCNCLNDKLKENNIIFNDVFFNENEYAFIIKEKLDTSINIIKPDFYIKDINLCIEFYGDYWHGWLDSDTSLKRREFDKKRLNVLKYNYGCDTIIIWEHEYKKDKEKTINDLIIKIKDYARTFNN